jgi:hypothetical protein
MLFLFSFFTPYLKDRKGRTDRSKAIDGSYNINISANKLKLKNDGYAVVFSVMTLLITNLNTSPKYTFSSGYKNN